jgi:hypothetical protein
MITDVPTEIDFQQAGVGFLNLAWDAAYELVIYTRHFREFDYWGDEEKEFWQSAQGNLATALALTQQGIELLLKARIAQVSPFLLLDSGWCKGHDKTDVSFSDFRTIDSQDLIRAHDTVQSNRLPDDFKRRVGELRTRRNAIFHTVDKRLQFTATDVLSAILDAVHNLIGPHRWTSLRRAAIAASPVNSLASDYHEGMLAQEVALVVDAFSPSDVFRFLGLNKKQRRYLCLACHQSCTDFDDPLECKFAVLRPNTPESTTVFCFVCNAETPVLRVACKAADCKGNVIHAEDAVCLSCLENQEREPSTGGI